MMKEATAILLEPVGVDEAEDYYRLYKDLYGGKENVFLPQETPERFTNRIRSQCTHLYTIRLLEKPRTIVGDCALHHHKPSTREIEIGCALLPTYRRRGIMQAALARLIQIAKEDLGVIRMIARTTPDNKPAILLAEKMGFERVEECKADFVLQKMLG